MNESAIREPTGTPFKDNLRSWLYSFVISQTGIVRLSEEEVLERAFTPEERAEYRATEQDCEDSHRELCERTQAHVDRLGEQYRRELDADSVRGRVRGR